MHAHDDRDQFTPPQPPGRRRAVTLAVLAHLVLLAALTWGVAWKGGSDQPAVVAELWSAVPQQAAPRADPPPTPVPPTPPKPVPEPVVPPPPKPAPPPPPEPPKRAEPDRREADIAIEREKQRVEKEKREREEKQKLEREKKLKEHQRLEQEKKDQLAKEKAEHEKDQKRLAEEKRKKDEAIEKASAKAADERRQENIRRMQGLAGAAGAPTATGNALRDSGPSGGYGGRVAAKVKPNIVYPDAVSGNPRAEVEVNTSPDGTIVSTRLAKSSGNKAWDDAVLRALEKTATLPRDTDGRVPSSLVIGFRPQD